MEAKGTDMSKGGQRWSGKWRLMVFVVSKKSFLHIVWYRSLFKGVILWNAAKSIKEIWAKTHYKDLYLEPRHNNRHHYD